MSSQGQVNIFGSLINEEPWVSPNYHQSPAAEQTPFCKCEKIVPAKTHTVCKNSQSQILEDAW